MQVVKTISDIRASRQQLKGSVGFVPTMGFLHEGHLALVKRAKAVAPIRLALSALSARLTASGESAAMWPIDWPW